MASCSCAIQDVNLMWHCSHLLKIQGLVSPDMAEPSTITPPLICEEQEINLNATVEQETACKITRIQNVVRSTIQPLSTSRTTIHVEVKAF